MAKRKTKTPSRTRNTKETKSPKRQGTKQQRLIEMLRRPQGATIEQITGALGWQSHTVRGAISGALKKKLSLTVLSEKVDGGRIYRISASEKKA